MKQVIDVSGIVVTTRKKDDCTNDKIVGEIKLHLCGLGSIEGYQVLINDDGSPGLKLKSPHCYKIENGMPVQKPVFVGEIQEHLDKLIWSALLAIKTTQGSLRYQCSYLYDVNATTVTIINQE